MPLAYHCRAITDINAFGPRNYAAEVLPTTKQIHNKPKQAAASADFDLDVGLR